MGAFTFGVDSNPPVVDSITPQDDAFGIAVSTPINVEINDPASGVDVSTIQMTIAFNGFSHRYTIGRPSDDFGELMFIRDQFDNNVNIEFEPATVLPSGTNITVEIEASDYAGNEMETFSFIFDTADIANFSVFTNELELNSFLAGTWEKTIDVGCVVNWKLLEWVGTNIIDDENNLIAYSLFQVAPYNGDVRENCEDCAGVLDEDAPSSPVNFYGESGVAGSGGSITGGTSNLYDATKPFTIDLSGQAFVFIDGPHAGEEYTIITNTEDTLVLNGFTASETASSISYEAGDNVYFSLTPANVSIVPDSTKALVRVWLISNANGVTPIVKDVNLTYESFICQPVDNLQHYFFDTFADELHANRMSIYHTPDGFLHFRIYDNSKSAFPRVDTYYEKDTSNFVKNFANGQFFDAAQCDEDSDTNCDTALSNAVKLQQVQQEHCGNYLDRGNMIFNYNDQHAIRCDSDQRNFYELTADISDWVAEDCHWITASWRLNNREEGSACLANNCEMHLFIDGEEVANIIRAGTGVLYGNAVYGAPTPLSDDLGIVSTRCKIVQLTRSENDPVYLCSAPRSIDSIKITPIGWIQDSTVQWNRGESHDISVDGNEMRLSSPEVCIDGERVDPTLTARWPCTFKHFGIFVSEIHDGVFHTHWETVGWDVDYSHNLREVLVNDTDCAGNAVDPCSTSRVPKPYPLLEINDFEIHFDTDFDGYQGAYHDGYGIDPYAHLPDGYDANCDENENCDSELVPIDTNRIFVRLFYRIGDHPDAMGPWTRAQDNSCSDGYDDCISNVGCDFADNINENGRYIQYRAEFFSDTFETPVIKKIKFTGQPVTSEGCFSASTIINRERLGLREIVFSNSTG